MNSSKSRNRHSSFVSHQQRSHLIQMGWSIAVGIVLILSAFFSVYQQPRASGRIPASTSFEPLHEDLRETSAQFK